MQVGCLIDQYTVRPLKFYINVTLDGRYDHTARIADEDLDEFKHIVEPPK